MGWTFTPMYSQRSDRARMIQDRIRHQENDEVIYDCLAHCLRGNVLWSVWEITKKDTGSKHRFIGCDLIEYGGRDNGWGYKDMDESCGLFQYSCPLKYFKMVPVPPNEYAREWRETVIAKRACKPARIVKNGCQQNTLKTV